MTRNILFLLVATALLSGCATLFQKPDPTVGQWDYHLYNLPQGSPDGIMTISKEDNVYKGTMGGDNQWELNDLVIEGNTLVSGSFRARGYHVVVSGTFAGDTFTGQIDAEGNVFEMTAERME